jgi:preprotein translocase subunit SecE
MTEGEEPRDVNVAATGSTPGVGDTGGRAPGRKKKRTPPAQFLREVRSELRKVAWPSRRELMSYSVVVLVAVTLVTLYITGLDQAFGFLILRIFGQ